jgi:hypothetical protein
MALLIFLEVVAGVQQRQVLPQQRQLMEMEATEHLQQFLELLLPMLEVVVAVVITGLLVQAVLAVLAGAGMEHLPFQMSGAMDLLTREEEAAAVHNKSQHLLLAQAEAQAAPALSFSNGLKPYRSQTPLHLQEHG